MLYRRNEKGRFEAVTNSGDIIPISDKEELVRFIEERERLYELIGQFEEVRYENLTKEELFPPERTERNIFVKKVKIRIHKGEYVTDGNRLIKKRKTA